mmetsp:Transcript_7529/g.15085  ORF Transcript_7529/g.15085 Transcript_7529/m.15085 type:complete len:399 (-) Transcript_7529:1794-2990(-)|eukprot:CAMPEP_0178724874 /NCGR_PEP_ID=MMETSP0699-20121125/26336_1 /TAXON_ID=265572 /ORGANISM="Extubocellulus spinifer, Strain CCMP396" /LENGTH=398 /DNA_ID=CAMNT_0020376097 /DNA_START=361 /DNA_END=1557 /DNA_ORIENTATION=+
MATDPLLRRKKLRALQFNVWLDGARVRDGLSLIANAIIDSEADVVSLVEVKNLKGDFVERLKRKLKERGVLYYGTFQGNPRKFGLDADTAILSRFPITEESVIYRTRENCIVRSLIDLSSDDDNSTPHILAVYSVHLEYRCYSCYLPRGYNSYSNQFPGWSMIRNGKSRSGWLGTVMFWLETVVMFLARNYRDIEPQPMTDAELIQQDNIESTRPEAIRHLIDDAGTLEENIPIIVMGDFNEPSTLDWTESMSHIAGHNGLVYKWDTTELLDQSGFIDAYRHLYPDPVTHPGFTWPSAAQGPGEREMPKRTNWIKRADERDRLDYIFFKDTKNSGCELKAADAWLVGTPVTLVRDEFVDESKLLFQDKYSYGVGSPWPSDHRAVMTVFETIFGATRQK